MGRESSPSRPWRRLRRGRREGSWRGGRGWRQQPWGRGLGSWAGAAWTTRTSRETREDIHYSGHHRERRGRAWRRGRVGVGWRGEQAGVASAVRAKLWSLSDTATIVISRFTYHFLINRWLLDYTSLSSPHLTRPRRRPPRSTLCTAKVDDRLDGRSHSPSLAPLLRGQAARLRHPVPFFPICPRLLLQSTASDRPTQRDQLPGVPHNAGRISHEDTHNPPPTQPPYLYYFERVL